MTVRKISNLRGSLARTGGKSVSDHFYISFPTGERYKKHPALVPFGVGKRQCMGEALARHEVILFTVGLLQRLAFLPSDTGPCPDPEEYHVSVTRIPTDFHVKIKQIL